eukprot:GHVN01059376.1.p1 GENE.GHVN01059376.1~~GHVN01059376.1.p1  ORF type:complete len:422 (+),score=51.64 GHVN01059376.1:1824-3089(+)
MATKCPKFSHDIIKATAPALRSRGVDVTRCMYQHLFSDYPVTRPLFNATHQAQGAQPMALAEALVAYAENIDNLSVLGGAVERIAQKHCSLNILPQHYDYVGASILKSLSETLDPPADVAEAWTGAYCQLSDVLINREEELYSSAEKKAHGWRGYKRLKVAKKIEEAGDGSVTSYYFVSPDGKPMPMFHAGQYVGLKAQVPGEPHEYSRNYTLSDAPNGDYFRISVRNMGVFSNWMQKNLNVGDEMECTMPFGVNQLAAGDLTDKHLVFVSTGIHLTGILAMLNHMTIAKNIPKSIKWCVGVNNSKSFLARTEIKSLQDVMEPQSLITRTYFSNPLPRDSQGFDFNEEGHITVESLRKFFPDKFDDDTIFFLATAPELYRELKDWLLNEKNVKPEQIFGHTAGPWAGMDSDSAFLHGIAGG